MVRFVRQNIILIARKNETVIAREKRPKQSHYTERDSFTTVRNDVVAS